MKFIESNVQIPENWAPNAQFPSARTKMHKTLQRYPWCKGRTGLIFRKRFPAGEKRWVISNVRLNGVSEPLVPATTYFISLRSTKQFCDRVDRSPLCGQSSLNDQITNPVPSKSLATTIAKLALWLNLAIGLGLVHAVQSDWLAPITMVPLWMWLDQTELLSPDLHRAT